MRSQRANQRTVRGFTLVEILVVMAIIAILITISVVLAGRVTQGGRVRATENLIKVLDNALTSYMADRESKVPAVFRDDAGEVFPLWDGREDANNAVDRDAHPAEPSLAMFLFVARDVPAIDTMIKGIDARFLKTLPDLRTPAAHNNPLRMRPAAGQAPVVVSGITVLDAWGRPIRFVHPAWDGGGGRYWDGSSLQSARSLITFDVDSDGNVGEAGEGIRRSYRPFEPDSVPVSTPVGDADEGICVNGRPYFYSAGPDGDPGTREDNVYSFRPEFPRETAAFQ
jgi:prepilin-type N-terminal cleavage/methylation domain-containing protein